MSQTEGYVNVSVVFGIKIVFGSDHCQYFSAFGVKNQGGTVCYIKPLQFFYFLLNDLLGQILNADIQGRNYFQTTCFDNILSVFIYQFLSDIHYKMGSLDVRLFMCNLKFLAKGFLLLFCGYEFIDTH